MSIGKIDPESAIREGWARDSDDEIYMDGYNAFIQVTTHDGTSGFQVKNDIGAVVFSSNSNGDGYVAQDLIVNANTTTYSLKVIDGAVNGYVLTSDSSGNATWQPADSGSSADLSDIEEAIQTILKDLDGYHPDVTGQEHYYQLSNAIQIILKDLDGYGAASQDEKVKVSSNDTTAGYLNGKIIAGSGVTLTEVSDGGNETLEVSASLDGYITDGYHRELDQLVHRIVEDSYEEITYGVGNRIDNITVWTNSGKTMKVREEQNTYTGNNITQILTIQYDPNGNETERMTETMTYSGVRVTSITRDFTLL